MAKKRFQRREAFGPQAFIGAEPFIGVREWFGIELAVVGPSAHAAPDEARLLECLDVLRGGCERHLERLGEFAYGVLLPGEPAEHGAAGRITQRAEDAVEGVRSHNHVVEYVAVAIIVNPVVE
jgi:hypothetical protein